MNGHSKLPEKSNFGLWSKKLNPLVRQKWIKICLQVAKMAKMDYSVAIFQFNPLPFHKRGSLSSFLQLHGQEYGHIWGSVCHTIKSVKERLELLGNQEIWRLCKYELTA